MWQQTDDGGRREWAEALAYCEALELAGHDDWRLPNSKALQSIVDYRRTSFPAIDETAFSITEDAETLDFWTPPLWRLEKLCQRHRLRQGPQQIGRTDRIHRLARRWRTTFIDQDPHRSGHDARHDLLGKRLRLQPFRQSCALRALTHRPLPLGCWSASSAFQSAELGTNLPELFQQIERQCGAGHVHTKVAA